jgi:nucleoside-diphosphate-sugar epimerase
MLLQFKRNLCLETIVRIAADIVLLNIAALSGAIVQTMLADRPLRAAIAPSFFIASAFLTIAGPLVFGAFGFYTKGRFYAGRYKALAIVQATALLFLLLAACNGTFLSDVLSASLVLTSWATATLSIGAARFWAWIWRIVVERENHLPQGTVWREHPKLLLIGGAGYIGSSLLPRLLQRGYKVRLMDAFVYGEDPIADQLGHPNLEVMRADFRNVHDVVYAMRDVDSVVHLGAIVGDPACALDPDLTVEVNLLATRTIAEVAQANGVHKFVFASTCSVYGASDELLDERSALHPVSLYARSKIGCERVLLSLRDGAFCPVILRFGTIYGLSGRTRFDLVVNLLAAKAVSEGRITVYGREQWRPFLHVHDAARAVLAVLEARNQQLAECVFNTGSDEQNYTLGTVGEIINRMVPTAELICTDWIADRRNYRVDFSRIRRTLNFFPQYTMEQGIQQVLDAIRCGAVADYQDPKYSNVKILSEGQGREILKPTRDWADQMLAEVVAEAQQQPGAQVSAYQNA